MSLRVGLVGAGPWAAWTVAPMLAAGPGTRLAGVWARRPEAAAELAAARGVPAFAGFGDLLAGCDAVAFAVPPDVQAELAVQAARAGKHLLLEKPLALTVAAAEAVVGAVDDAGVVTQLGLTNRWTDAVGEFLGAAGAHPVRAVEASFISGAATAGSPFATPWRRPAMALYDLGPHVLDLLEAVAGPSSPVFARLSGGVLSATLEHAGGAVSSMTLSITTPDARGPLQCTAVTDGGRVVLGDLAAEDPELVRSRLAGAFAAAVRTGVSGAHDVHRGLELQRLLHAIGELATTGR